MPVSDLKRAIRKSVSHWKRLRKWMKKQDPKEVPFSYKMRRALGEGWGGSDCALCNYYYYKCYACILAKYYTSCGQCREGKKGTNAYNAVIEAATWRGAIYHSDRLIKQLESLLTLEE